MSGWEIAIAEHFTEPGVAAVYEYDFGDGWEHEVLLEGILLKEQGVKYPRCIAGKRTCPPEDCGGVLGYYRILEILGNPKHEEYQETVVWAKGQTRGGHTYRPDKFDPEEVHFDNPKKRWKIALKDELNNARVRHSLPCRLGNQSQPPALTRKRSFYDSRCSALRSSAVGKGCSKSQQKESRSR
ncbi:MAG: plasmid pRiA4b ORF-3 family protein [Syntrophobacteraceae bacterium]